MPPATPTGRLQQGKGGGRKGGGGDVTSIGVIL